MPLNWGRRMEDDVPRLNKKTGLFLRTDLMLRCRSAQARGTMSMTIPPIPFDARVPANLVHKRDKSEVFPRALVHARQDEMWAGVRWPAQHRFYRPGAHGVDSYLIIETIRQLTILACHEHYATPLDAHFLMSAIGTTIQPSEGHRVTLGKNIAVHLRGASPRFAPDGSLRHVRIEATFFCEDGQPFATGYGDARIVTSGLYARVRSGRTTTVSGGPAHAPGTAWEPHRVGHSEQSSVVVSRNSSNDTFALALDLNDTTLFDHPLDHIAGMIPVEAARQILRLISDDPHAEISSSYFEFNRALEFGSPITVIVDSTHSTIDLSFQQDDATAVTAHLIPAIERPCSLGSTRRSVHESHPADSRALLLAEQIATTHECAGSDLLAR